jgi:hypothetical protein
MKWCCSLFSEAIHDDSPEGLNIVVVTDHDRNNRFALQFRAVEENEQEILIGKIGFFNKRVILKWTQFINFCPWCGKDLRKFYKNHIFNNAKDIDSFVEPKGDIAR